MFDIPCVILAGGKSSRMEQNKALLPFGGFASLCEFQHERLKAMFDKVFINTKNRDVFNFDANFLIDIVDDIFSPAVALYSVLKTLNSPVFILSVDTPFVDEQTINTLIGASENGSITTIASSPLTLHPLCGIYSVDSLVFFREMVKENEHKLQKVLENLSHKIVSFDNDEMFFNLNEKKDYDDAVKMHNQYIV